MSAAKVAVIAAACAVAVYAAGSARVPGRSSPASMQRDSLAPGPDSARIAKLLDGLASSDRLVCELVADQTNNFWSDGPVDGFGAFSDASRGMNAVKDSLHGHVRQGGAIALLTARLGSDDACVRRVAAKLLARSTITTERLVALLDHATPRVREAAAYAIGEGNRHGARTALEARLGGRDNALASMSSWALSELHDSASIPALTRAARSANPMVRIGVVRALGEIQDERTVGEVERALRDGHAGVRHAAAHALGEIGLAQSAEALASVLSDGNADVRYAAAGSLGELHDLHTAPGALVRAASSTDAQLAELAVHSLAEIKDPATVDVMVSALTHANREIRLSAVRALGEMGSAKAVPGLLRALKDTDAEVRRAAAEALGELKEG